MNLKDQTGHDIFGWTNHTEDASVAGKKKVPTHQAV